MYRTLFLVLCLVAASHQFNVIKFAVPDAVQVDGDAELSCEHEAGQPSITKWWWKPATGGQHLIYQYFRVGDSKQQVNIPNTEPLLNVTIKKEGKDNLLLRTLQPEHSGAFECEVFEETGNYTERINSADLVVYSSVEPHLTSLDVDDDVVFVCEAVGVAPEPEITISYNSDESNTTLVDGPVDGLYNASVNVTVTRADIEGETISCKLSFKDVDIPITAVQEVSLLYKSDAWLATSTAAPDETTEYQATLDTNQTMPGSAANAGFAWGALAALAILLHLRVSNM